MVARWQLEAIGVTLSMLKTRVARGSLTRLHRGVYAVGHRRLRPAARSLAAVLAVGPDAVASHRDAAWLHGLRPGNHTRADVSTTRRIRSTPDIRVHRTTVLTPADVTTVNRIPATTVARALVDLAGVVPADHLLKAINEAERHRSFDLRAVEAAAERTRQRAGGGHRALEAALRLHRERGLELTRIATEDLFSAFVDARGFPRPELNAIVDGEEVDACWRDARVIVELDGWRSHGTHRAGERDREKTNGLLLRGWVVLRYTHRQLLREPERLARELAVALAL